MPDEIKEFDINSDEAQKLISEAADKRYAERYQADYNENVKGLISKNQEILEEKRAKASELEALKGKYDFEKFDLLQAEAEKLKEQEMSHEERWEYRKDQMLEGFAKEREELLDKIVRKDSALTKNLIDAQLTTALVEAGAEPYLAQDTLKKFIQVVAEGDDYKARIMKDGNPRLYGSSGDLMTIPQLVAEFKEDERYGSWFGASGASGGGVQGNQALPGMTNTDANLNRSRMDAAEKSAYITKNGSDAYMLLPL